MPRNQRLYEDIRNGRENEVALYMSSRTDPVFFDSRRNVMHVAAYFNKPEIISRLKHNYWMTLLIDHVDDRGKTPLMVAASKGHMRCVELLMNPTVINKVDDLGITALMYSIGNRHFDIAKYLLENRADYTIIARNGYRVHLNTVYRLVPELLRTPTISPIRNSGSNALRFRRRRRSDSIVEDVFRIQQERQAAITIAESFFPSDIIFYTPSTPPTPPTPPTPLEAPVPEHFKNEFIEMAIELKKSCSICLEPFEKDKTVFTKCSHLLCTGCFEEPRVTKCPLCRIDIK